MHFSAGYRKCERSRLYDSKFEVVSSGGKLSWFEGGLRSLVRDYKLKEKQDRSLRIDLDR